MVTRTLNNNGSIIEAEVNELLKHIRNGRADLCNAHPLCNARVTDILRNKVTSNDLSRLIEIIENTSYDKWLRCFAASSLRFFQPEKIAQILRRRFAAEQDIDVKIQLLFSIFYGGYDEDASPYYSFIEEHRDYYLRHTIDFSGGNPESLKALSLSRLQDPRCGKRRWLYLLNLEGLNFQGSMIRGHGIRKLFKSESGEIRGIQEVNLDVKKGEFITIFGPNGSGKSTLLNIIAGLVEPDDGELSSEYGELSKINKCYVWQNYRDALLPWRDVSENIAFPLKLAGIPKDKRNQAVDELMHRFGINIDRRAKVYSLSGGEQQIVSILRGLITEPEIMLLDEPFSALDYQMNLTMEGKIMDIWAKTKITTVFVSHDLDQAILLADRLILLTSGPGLVKRVFENPLPRPRTLEMLSHPEHIALKREILGLFSERGIWAT